VAGTSLISNVNFYLRTFVQRKATIQVVGAVGAGGNGGRMLFYTKDDAAVGTDVSLAGYIDFSTGGAGGGLVWGAPTGGSCGGGCINAKSVRDDNVVLTDWVNEEAYGVPSENRRAATPAGKRLYSLEETRRTTQREYRLPWMPTPETFEKERHLGGMVTRLWQGQEQQQLYFFEMADRIAALEAEVTRLKVGVKQ